MKDAPELLQGIAAIAAFLGISTRHAQHLHSRRQIPTWLRGGSPVATEAGLEDWKRFADRVKLFKQSAD